MIEDFLTQLITPLKTIRLLTSFLREQILDESIFLVSKNQYDKNENTLAINYAINLVNDDILKLRKKYYKKMYKMKYGK